MTFENVEMNIIKKKRKKFFVCFKVRYTNQKTKNLVSKYPSTELLYIPGRELKYPSYKKHKI